MDNKTITTLSWFEWSLLCMCWCWVEIWQENNTKGWVGVYFRIRTKFLGMLRVLQKTPSGQLCRNYWQQASLSSRSGCWKVSLFNLLWRKTTSYPFWESKNGYTLLRNFNRVFHKHNQYKNGNITSFVLAPAIKINKSNKKFNFVMWSFYALWFLISHFLTSVGANIEENHKHKAIQSWQ